MTPQEEKIRTQAFVNELARQRNEAQMDLANAMGEVAVLKAQGQALVKKIEALEKPTVLPAGKDGAP